MYFPGQGLGRGFSEGKERDVGTFNVLYVRVDTICKLEYLLFVMRVKVAYI